MKYFFKCLQLYANSGGRARRAEYWYFTLFNFIFAVFVGIIAEIIKAPILSVVYSFAIFLPGFTVGMRRMHDTGKKGWYFLIPIYNLILACTEGQPGSNEYGPDPKSFDELDVVQQY